MHILRRFSTLIFVAVLLTGTLTRPVLPFDEESFISDYLWQRFIRLKPPQRPRIALVLGGGGARGLAHIGVLKVLDEEKIPIDMIVGTSVGALVGALYSAGEPVSRIETIGQSVDWNNLADVKGSSLVKLIIHEQLLSAEKLEHYLNDKIGPKRFSDLPIPFACVATDLMSGERLIMRDGEVAIAARASATIPGIFAPVEYRHRFLVDGGIYDNLPTDVAKLLGADIVIAVAVQADISKHNVDNVFMTLTQAIYIQGRVLDEGRMKEADILIRPQVGDVSAVDLGRSAECIDAGIASARQAMAELKLTLIKRTPDRNLFK